MFKTFTETVRVLTTDPVFKLLLLFRCQCSRGFHGNAAVQFATTLGKIPHHRTQFRTDRIVSVEIFRHVFAVLGIELSHLLTYSVGIPGGKASVFLVTVSVNVIPTVSCIECHGEWTIEFCHNGWDNRAVQDISEIMEGFRGLICNFVHDFKLLFIR